eukprot:1157276-Pelagomonas_calceolata.AAC.1
MGFGNAAFDNPPPPPPPSASGASSQVTSKQATQMLCMSGKKHLTNLTPLYAGIEVCVSKGSGFGLPPPADFKASTNGVTLINKVSCGDGLGFELN